jgi:hypothetical protein
MSYYGQGDIHFLRRRGDPGFFDFLKKVGSTIVHVAGGAVLGTLTGGPVAGIAGAVKGALTSGRANLQNETMAAGGSESALTPVMIARHKAVLARGRGIGQGIPGIDVSLKGAGRHRGAARARRMNHANVHALKRSVRRLTGFYKLSADVMKSLRPIVAHAHKGRRRALASVPAHLQLKAGDYYNG